MQRLPENWAFEVDLDGYNISVGHRLQGEHRLAVMERRSSRKGEKNYTSDFYWNFYWTFIGTFCSIFFFFKRKRRYKLRTLGVVTWSMACSVLLSLDLEAGRGQGSLLEGLPGQMWQGGKRRGMRKLLQK